MNIKSQIHETHNTVTVCVDDLRREFMHNSLRAINKEFSVKPSANATSIVALALIVNDLNWDLERGIKSLLSDKILGKIVLPQIVKDELSRDFENTNPTFLEVVMQGVSENGIWHDKTQTFQIPSKDIAL